MKAATFHAIISGRRRGIAAFVCRGLLWLLSHPYSLAVRIRNRRFDPPSRDVHCAEIPIISVGNLTTGGTGKTPLVAWLVSWFRQHDIRVSILSRGYGAERGSINDEARQLEELLPDVPHLQDPDRVEIARIAFQELDSQIAVLDDGFQHRRLHRDLDIVLIDCTNPFGHGYLFPRGLLREPKNSLNRADMVILTRADQVTADAVEQIDSQIKTIAPELSIAKCLHEPKGLRDTSGTLHPITMCEQKSILAFCGIGNPDSFRQVLVRIGMKVEAFLEFPDHHRYDRDDIKHIQRQAESHPDIEAIICTHKDLVKVDADRIGSCRLLAVDIELKMTEGQQLLEQMLLEIKEQILTS